MPKYEITSPDGKRFEITAPDGATQEDVLAYAQKSFQPTKAAVATAKKPAAPVDPTEGMSGYDKFMAGIGKSVVDTGRGLKQAGTDAARYFVEEGLGIQPSRNTSNLIAGGYSNDNIAGRLRNSLAAQQAVIDEAGQIDSPLMDTGAGVAGNVTGVVGQIVGPGGLAKLVARVPMVASSAAAPAVARAGAAFLPRTLTGNAVQGSVIGAAQPTTSDSSRAMNTVTGGLAGFGGAALPRLAGAAVRGVAGLMPAVNQRMQTRAAGEVLNQFAENPAALRGAAANPKTIVPGSLPTLAEASGDVGLAGLQRTLANTPEFGNALTLRQQGNNLARVRFIEEAFGGADDAASAAIRETRDRAASRILRPIDSLPMSSLNKVVAGVQRLSEKHQASPAVREAMQAVKSELPNIRTVGDAHAVRQYIGQLIGGQVEGKAGAKLAKRELMTVQGLLDREMRAAYPEWGKFLREYKGASRQADQVDVGAELLGTGRAVRSATNDPALTPAAFGRAAGNLDRTVRRATGFNRATAERTLTAQQRQAVDSVRLDLERYSRASTDGKAVGSNTVQNAIGGNSFQSAVGPVGAAVVEPVSGIALMGLNQMRAKFGGKVAELVEEAMLDPARAAEILAAVPASQRTEVVRAAARLIPRVGGAAGAAVVPAIE